MEAVLETIHLTKRFGRQTVVSDVNLAIPAGSIYGLLGPNGAGKTTALKVITGLLRPSEGEVRLFGQTFRRQHLAQVGALIENPALYGNLTAAENLEVHRRMLGLPKERIRAVLGQVDLTGTGSKRTAHFSLGMKQRLGIALALLGEPRLLILDEPTNGLDPIGIQEMRHLIRSFQADGITVVISSHMLNEVERLVSHLGIISGGRLLYQGPLVEHENLEAFFMHTVSQAGDQEVRP